VACVDAAMHAPAWSRTRRSAGILVASSCHRIYKHLQVAHVMSTVINGRIGDVGSRYSEQDGKVMHVDELRKNVESDMTVSTLIFYTVCVVIGHILIDNVLMT